MKKVTLLVFSLAWLTTMAYSSLSAFGVQESLLFWGSDKILESYPNDGKFDFKSLNIPKPLSNIISVSSTQNVLSIVAHSDGDPTLGLSLFLLDLSDKNLRKIQQIKGLKKAVLSPQKSLVALIICISNGCNLEILDLSTGHRSVITKDHVLANGTVTWSNDGEKIAFDTQGGLIKILILSTKTEFASLEGSLPSWSPDVSMLAFVRDKNLLLYEFDPKKETKLYKRYFWQTAFTGDISWNNNNSAVAVNVPAGLTGYEFKCFIVDVKSKQSSAVYSGSYRCGPWVAPRVDG